MEGSRKRRENSFLFRSLRDAVHRPTDYKQTKEEGNLQSSGKREERLLPSPRLGPRFSTSTLTFRCLDTWVKRSREVAERGGGCVWYAF